MNRSSSMPLSLALLAGFLACKSLEPATPPAAAKSEQTARTGPREIPLSVTDEGFVPASVPVKLGEPLQLVVTRTTEQTCATELLIDGTDINVKLPLNEAVRIAYTPDKAGKITFGCAMDKMVAGVLLVE